MAEIAAALRKHKKCVAKQALCTHAGGVASERKSSRESQILRVHISSTKLLVGTGLSTSSAPSEGAS